VSITNAERQLKQIRQLARSPGWKVIEQIMRDEIVTLALSTAKNPNKTPQEAAYYAGCLQASENLLHIIPNLEAKLQGSAQLESWEKRDDPNPIDDPLSLHEQLNQPLR